MATNVNSYIHSRVSLHQLHLEEQQLTDEEIVRMDVESLFTEEVSTLTRLLSNVYDCQMLVLILDCDALTVLSPVLRVLSDILYILRDTVTDAILLLKVLTDKL